MFIDNAADQINSLIGTTLMSIDNAADQLNSS